MGELGARQLCSFDPVSAELYASVSSDNRLRIWNTGSGELRQQYVEPRHLSKQYTCIAWHRRAPQAKRGSSGASKSTALGMIALGTDKGSISVWDLKRGALAHSLGEGEGLPNVTSVAFSSDGSSLYSASSGKELVEWNVETGAVVRKLKGFKHGCTQICLHPLGKILAIASSSIRLLDLATGKVARKLSAGHAGAVRALSFSADGRYLASSASSARFVNVFDVAGEAAPSEPVSTLSFEATPLYVALRASFGGGEGGDEVTVVAGFDTGGVSVLRTRRTGDGKDGAASKLNIRGAAGSASPSALHACLSYERPTSAILLATGSPASPGFVEALYQDSAGVLLSSSTIGGGLGEDGGGGGEEAGVKGLPPHVVGPGELGVRGSEKDLAGTEGGEEAGRLSKRLKGASEEGGVVGQEGVGESSMSIAERLEALSAAIDEEADRSGSSTPGGSGGVLALAGGGGGGAVQPRAESLSTVLTQALQSGDESLLEQCLAVGEQGVIEATVQRLPSAKVLQFLLRVVAKLEKRPNRAAALGQWIRALLSCHLGYLVSVPGLPDKLALLHQLIDRRVASFPKLLQLHGRLDLLLARAKAEGGTKRGGGGRAMDRPEAVYREEDDEEEEEEDGEEEEGSGEEEEDSEEGSDDSGDDEEGASSGSGEQEDMEEDDD
eukprot:jgi/Undpi1/12161/HiC_scaffold_5.g01837.m1